MSDQYIEKLFLYFVVVSLLVHLGIFAFVVFMPDSKKQNVGQQQQYIVDLEDLPELKTPPPKVEKKAKRQSEPKNRVIKEVAPKGEMPTEKRAHVPRTLVGKTPQAPVQIQEKSQNLITRPRAIDTARPSVRGGELLRQRKDLPEIAKLYPGVNGLADLEQSYRKKYGPEVEEGETKFLNTDDILFGSFLRRFETAVYGVWRYPSDAARLGIQGVTPVKITFNRRGEIENVQLLESSGSKILDKEVFRTLGVIGPIGSLPKGYTKDKFHLVAFFQYGIFRGAGKGVLH